MRATSTLKVESSAHPDSSIIGKDEKGIKVREVNASRWSEALKKFDDANIYQTWAYGEVRSGPSRVSRVIVEDGTDMIAAAQARLALLPLIKVGVAYILYGPAWTRRGATEETERLRLAIRGLRSEYVTRRGLVLRIVPNLCDSDGSSVRDLFADEGYLPTPRARERRTIVMDLRASLDDLSRGLHQKWRYNLKKARGRGLEILEGEENEMFRIFERMYEEMKRRKGLPGLTDLRAYRRIQENLAPEQKLKVFLCKSQGEFCAGGICSAIGNTGIYLFGATSDFGTQTYASYLIHWRMLEWVKSEGCEFYDLNGINSLGNAGGYQFKSQLAGTSGREVHLASGFDAYPNAATKILLATVEALKAKTKKV